ncbi:MAG: sigma 54-interacting transcriptional regulator [Anaerotruncus sp.]|nr:sigma 54-interacting transcriptional regulator [Anaerotruncus sp.]
MIHIVMIAPYEQSRPFIQGVVDRYEPGQPVSITVEVFENEEIPFLSINGDIIIARGYNMHLIKDLCKSIPVIPLDVSGYDIIKAVSDAQKRYQAQKIAIIGPPETINSIENIRDILNVSIQPYSAGIHEIDRVLETARRDGCDCFVGGYSVFEHCRSEDHKILVHIGKSTIINSLDEAIRTVNLLRDQERHSLRFQSIIGHLKEGIVTIDENGNIISANQSAQEYLHLDTDMFEQPVKQLLPSFHAGVTSVLQNGRRLENEIYQINNYMLVVDYIPLETGGITLFLRSVDKLQQEESLLRKKLVTPHQYAKYTFDSIIHSSRLLNQTIEDAKLYAQVDSPVLITGESGTGKELMAQSIHNASSRRKGPFIGINCAALPESLLESELFGYSDGAFTGALKGGREGLFEAAHGGTLFLDEISEIPPSFQSKLLRVLQENEVRRVGSQQVVSIDVRILAATNRDLAALVESGSFRQDLFFRLNVLPLEIPPLRERPEDILALFDSYLREYGERYHRVISVVTGKAKELLLAYPWHGNIRELKNIAERICVLSQSSKIGEDIVYRALYNSRRASLDPQENSSSSPTTPNEQEELHEIRALLKRYGGNKTKVAQYLGIDRTTLWRKLKRLNLEDAT